MPKFHNHFAGHMEPNDPRSLVTGAGGCAWPTVPAFRLLLHSDNATGEWAFLRSNPILLEQDIVASHHNYVLWRPLALPPTVYWCEVEKIYIPAQFPDFRYWLTFVLNAWDSERTWPVTRRGKCNSGVLWGRLWRTVQMGTTGSDFRQHQVEHDHTRPPGWLGP